MTSVDETWQHFDHAADMGIAAAAASIAGIFEQIAMGMMAIVTDAPVQSRECVDIDCAAPDREMLLVDWLNTLIFEMATRRLLFGSFSVRVEERADGCELHGRAWGEPVDRARHHPAVELKGATYTALDVHRDVRGTWHARCVVDV
jgi:tRNA nucleotidyltransferase (CCA-adding enzyme)